MDKKEIHKLNDLFYNSTAIDVLKWCYDNYDHDKIMFSTSFGPEGIIVTSILSRIIKNPKIFTIDTGRNFGETYDVWQKILERFKVDIDVVSPDSSEVSNLITHGGPNLFYQSVEKRKMCCDVRKSSPLAKALQNADVWITALRKDQSESRQGVDYVSWSDNHNVLKVSPIVDWSEADVWNTIRANGYPYNKLHDQGFPSIGCAPCTRAVRPAEGMRSGRWWWEPDSEKECGIHIEDGKVVRGNNDTISWNI